MTKTNYEDRRYRRYLLILCCLTLAGLSLASAVNYVIDPYNIFGTARIPGLNEVKPFAGNRGRTTKLHQVMQVKPGALILGNSRPEMGLDPAHACWPRAARPVYNIALPGLSVIDQFRYGEHGLATGDIGIVLIGLDFLDYLNRPGTTAKPSTPIDMSLVRRARDLVKAMVSLETLGSSLATAMNQRAAQANTWTGLGFHRADGYYQPIIQHEGVGILFAQKNQDLARQMTSQPWTLYPSGDSWSPDFEALKLFISRAKARGIEVIPYINPYHGEFLVLLELAGLWPQFETWKRQVAEIAAAESLASPVWDFTGFGAYATQAVAELAPRGESLAWFWEPSHYRSELGDLMLARLLSAHCPSGVPETSYGAPVTPAMITALARQRDRYMAENPKLVARLRKLIEESKQDTRR